MRRSENQVLCARIFFCSSARSLQQTFKRCHRTRFHYQLFTKLGIPGQRTTLDFLDEYLISTNTLFQTEKTIKSVFDNHRLVILKAQAHTPNCWRNTLKGSFRSW